MQNVSKSLNWLGGSFPCECSSFGPMVRVVGSEVKFMIRYQEMAFFLSSTARLAGSSRFPTGMEAPATYLQTTGCSKPLASVTA